MSARVGWLVQELEEENSSLQLELKSIQDERDLLQREVDEQRRLLKSCVEEVFSLKDELTQLMTSLEPPAAAERQQRLCERLARHVTEIEREVAEKGARAAEWRAERERREASQAELEGQLDRQRQESRRLTAELQQARADTAKQAEENRRKLAELEETVDCITKQKATVEENHAKEVESLKKSIKEAEESVRTASGSQQQLIAARREQERLARQLATARQRLAERETQQAEGSRQLTERTHQLADAKRSVEVKTAQVVGLKSALHDTKARNSQLQRDLDEKSKQAETQSAAVSRKDGIIRRQKVKLEDVAKDLNKLKTVFSDSDLHGLCECNEGAIGGSMRDLRALRGGRPPPACPARQLRITVADLKRQLETAHARTRELETSLDEIRQKLPQMSAEADRAYIELQAKLKEQQVAATQAQTQQRDQQKRNQQLVLKLAAESCRLKDHDQLVQRLRQENRSLLTDRVEWERTSTKLQSALHETVQLTARLQAARAELEAERRLTTQMRRRLDQADSQMKSQLKAVIDALHQLKQSAGTRPQVDWPRKYEELLDRCQEWQEECLARQKDCINMEQRLGMFAKQDRTEPEQMAVPQAEAGPEEAQLGRLERQLQALLQAVSQVAVPGQPARARSVPEMPVPSPRAGRWGSTDTSSGSIRTADGLARGVDRLPLSPGRGSQSSLAVDGHRSRSSLASDDRAPAAPQAATPSVGQAALLSAGQVRHLRVLSVGQAAPLSAGQVALLSVGQAAPVTGRSGLTSGSVLVPEMTPLLQRVTQVVSEVERQRDQLNAQGHLLEAYRQQAERWATPRERPTRSQTPADDDEEEPCRDGDAVSLRRAEAGGDDGLTPPPYTAQDAQTQSAAGGGPVPAAAESESSSPRRHRSSSRRRDQEQLERLAHFRALQELLNKMAAPTDTLLTGCLGSEVTVPDLTELRAQWRRLETMVRDETESARTRSDVILRLSGISESNQ